MPSTLLLADDSVTIQRVIELTFADEDVRVVAVSDGTEAIALLDQSPPDIVLADAEMPGQNGYEVARYIKGTARLAHIPVLLLKGAFEDIDKGRAEAVGCDGVLTKPFEPQEVITKVRELLARSKEGRSAPAPLEHWPDTPSEPIAVAAGVKVADAEPGAEATANADAPASRRGEFDTYLDRLDAALADLPTGPRGRAGTEQQGDREDRGAVLQPGAPEGTSAPGSAVPSFPPLGDAFGALLAAEQSASDPQDAPTWPVGPIAGFAAAAPAVSIPSDLVDQVARRVLAHMSDRVVRDTVREVVAGIAERLVKEEIARLKSAVPKRGDGGKG